MSGGIAWGQFSVGMVVSDRMRRGRALVALFCLFGRVAHGQESQQIVVDCALLDAERSAEVEARVRATLLTARVPEARVTISCTTGSAEVEVEADTRAARVALNAEAPELPGRLLDAVDRALSELARSGQAEPDASPEPVVEPRPMPPAAPPLPAPAPAPAPPRAPPSPPSIAPPAPRQTPAVLEAAALGLLEPWSHGLTVGGKAGLGYGVGTLRAGVAVGFTTLTPRDTAFRVHEWNAALELNWQPPWAYGVRAGLGLGASLLAVAPRADLTPRHGTTRGAGFAELSCSRPLWLTRHWAFAPRLALRVFTAKRTVNVNDAEALALSGVVPSFGLALLYRLE